MLELFGNEEEVVTESDQTPFVQLPFGILGKALGGEGGRLPVRRQSADYGVLKGCDRDKLQALFQGPKIRKPRGPA
jgi:hypothetical protein